MSKVYPSADAAVADLVDDGSTLAVGGFGLCGIPETLIAALRDTGWHVLEEALVADVALVKAWKGDRAGNLVYRRTARNFNPLCAAAGRVCVAEVEHLVDTGELDPDQIHTPGIYVDRIVLNPTPEKRVEQRTVRD